MNRDIIILREAISKVVQMLAGMGLTVTQRGSQAYVETDPKTLKPKRVNIPYIPDTATEELIAAIQGFMDHEVAHILFTDWTAVKACAGNPQLNDLQNIVEDPFIERMMGNKFPGAAHNIHILHDFFVRKITQPALDEVDAQLRAGKITAEEHTSAHFGILLVPTVRAWAGQFTFHDFMVKQGHYTSNKLIKLLLAKAPASLIARVPVIKDSWEALAIAKELHAILYPPPKPKQAPPPAPEPEDCDEDGEGEPSKDSKSSKKDSPGKGEKEHKKDSKNADGDQESDEKPEDANNEAGEGEGEAGENEGGTTKSSKDDKNDKSKEKKDDAEKDDGEAQDDDSGSETAGADGESPDGDGDDGSRDGSDREPSDGGQEAEGDEAEDGDVGGGSDPGQDDEGALPEGDGGDTDDAGDDGEPDSDEEVGAGDSDGDDEGESDGDGDDPGRDGDDVGADDDGDAASEGDEEAEGEGAGGQKGDGDEEGAEAGGKEKVTKEESDGDIDIDDANNHMKADGEKMEASGSPGIGHVDGDFEKIEVKPYSFEAMVRQHITDEAVRQTRDADYAIYSNEFDIFAKHEMTNKYTPSQFTMLDDGTRGMVGVMQKEIERMMAQRNRVFHVGGHKSGKLNAPGFSRILVNDPRVFKRKQEHQSKDTAVSLLVDNSGSMAGGKMLTAMTAAYALSSTLDRVNIQHECLGFTTDYAGKPGAGYDFYKIEAEADRLGVEYSRIIPLRITIFKDYVERLTPPVRHRFADMAYNQPNMMSNIDGEAVQIALNRLQQRKERRKVLLVMSDGMPAGGVSSHLYSHLHKVVENGTKDGVEIIGIGIQTPAVKSFYPKSVVLNDVDELPKMVMGELKKILLAS